MSGQDQGALLGEFLAEAEERTARVEQLLLDLPASGAEAPRLIQEARRELHTLKGNAGMMGFDSLRVATHQLEELSDRLDPSRPDIQPLLMGLDLLRSETAALDRRHEVGRRGAAAATGARLGHERLDSLVEGLGAQLLARQAHKPSGLRVADEGVGCGLLSSGYELAGYEDRGAFESDDTSDGGNLSEDAISLSSGLN